ncbi:MAG: hypothetical protein HY097_04890 [Nitrospinae bacterium]|nr:hypothetical protein [Nitrospinota bacterium]MBI3814573.1 hypothetical protein [Nitrospinota bacterium]
MARTLTKIAGQPHVSMKFYRYLKKYGHSNITLKDVQKSLSDIGISLSKRIIEEREKR